MLTPSIFTSVINSYLPEPQASLLNGIIFGVNLKTSKEFYLQLKMVGLLHLVVLSGANISLLAAMIGSLTGFLNKRISVILTILLIVLFVVFVGPQPPVVRAAFTGILTLVAIIYGRKNYALYALLLSLIFIAVFWPKWITTISLQLSYGATLGLILFGHRRADIKSAPTINYVINEFITSLSAQVFTAPIIFIYFKQISLISPLANVMVSFTIAPLMVFGFITAILGAIWHPLGLLPAYFCYGILNYMVWVVEWLSKIPGGYMSY